MTEVIQKVQLVEGKFSPSEASDIISALITEKINFHKLQRLGRTEGDLHADCEYPNSRVKELEDERMIAKEFIKIARLEGQNLKINGTLEISFCE
ncbi:MAG: hypothetical protein JXQ93_04705 [Flavobacteriaceae bacterium]